MLQISVFQSLKYLGRRRQESQLNCKKHSMNYSAFNRFLNGILICCYLYILLGFVRMSVETELALILLFCLLQIRMLRTPLSSLWLADDMGTPVPLSALVCYCKLVRHYCSNNSTIYTNYINI